MERPAARPPSLALAQCSTRTWVLERRAAPSSRRHRRPRRPSADVRSARVGDDAVVDVDAGALGETGVRGDADADDDRVGRQPCRPTSSRRRSPTSSPSMRSTPSPKRNSTPCAAVQVGEPAADLLPHDPEQRRGLRLDDGDAAARVAGGRGHLEADPAGTDDDDAGAVAKARLERLGLLHLAEVEHAVEVGARHVERAGRRARGDEQLVVGEGFAVGERQRVLLRRRGTWPASPRRSSTCCSAYQSAVWVNAVSISSSPLSTALDSGGRS